MPGFFVWCRRVSNRVITPTAICTP
jgi:hypothetical protein